MLAIEDGRLPDMLLDVSAGAPRHPVSCARAAGAAGATGYACFAPDVRERFNALGFVTIASSPEDLVATIRREVASHRKLAAQTGIGDRE